MMRKLLAVLWLELAVVACGGGGSPTGPSPTAQEPISAPLQVPGRLRAVWAPADRANGAVARLGANAVIVQIHSWGDDLSSYAAWSRDRGVGAIPYVEQCFLGPRSTWDACWANVERWSRPLAEAGVLWGYQVMDEPAAHGRTPITAEAVAYVRARGFDVLHTETIEYVSDQRRYKLPRPTGVRWYGVTCYAFDSRTPWHRGNCAEEYARHPDWDLVVIPESPEYNEATGWPYDRAAWEAIAGSSRSVAFWAFESE